MTATNLLVLAATRVQGMAGDPVRQNLAWREAAGLPTPVTVLDVLAALDREPEPFQVLDAMVADAASLDEKWLEGHIDRYRRAVQVQALRGHLDQAGRNAGGRRRVETAAGQFSVIAAPVSDALTRLATLAKALPEGEAALNPEASIDAGTTVELAETRDLLTRVGTMLGSLSLQGGSRRLNRWSLALVDVPDVEPVEWERPGTPILNPSPERDAVIAATQYADLDALVIDIARGAWPALSLRLVQDRTEFNDRAQRVNTAHLTENVRTARSSAV